MEFLTFECIIGLVLFPKGKDVARALANARRNKNNPNKMHQLSPKQQTGCPERTSYYNYINIILEKKIYVAFLNTLITLNTLAFAVANANKVLKFALASILDANKTHDICKFAQLKAKP